MPLLRAAGWLAYQLALGAGLVAAAPTLVLRGRGVGHYLPTLRHRLTLAPRSTSDMPRLWIHAVSVGEVGVAAVLLRALDASLEASTEGATLPVVVTTVTPTGQEQARAAFAERPATRIDYLPFDLGPLVERFLERHRPAALVLVEGDYWPLVLHKARHRGLPVAAINARVSDRAFARQRSIGRINRLFYAGVDRFGTQTAEDRDRLVELGAASESIDVTGNLKFDAPAPSPRPELEALVRGLADGRPVLVAGSTMDGEEDAVLDAYLGLRARGHEALLVLAPRHPERFDGVAARLAERDVSILRRSQSASGEPPRDAPADVLLLDTLGELAVAYAYATAAFVGGTLVATGGHNPLEPARFGVATAVGPSMVNFQAIAEQFDRADAWGRVTSSDELAELWARWLASPDEASAVGARARALVDAGRGAAARSVELLRPLLTPIGLLPATEPS
ncbi:MAG: glycosyltransferase N-terminal domain-containing protein [Acidobacteriota bacterium]